MSFRPINIDVEEGFMEHFWRTFKKSIPFLANNSRKMLLFSFKKMALKMLIALGADVATHLCSQYCLMLSVVSV